MFQDLLFAASKLLGPLLDPRVGLYLVLAAGIALLWTPWRRAGRVLATLAFVVSLALGSSPLGSLALNALENRFPAPDTLPAKIDGIVVLGGDIDPRMMRLRNATPGADAQRQIAFADLARRYPDAKLVYSGGSGRLIERDDTDSDGAKKLLPMLGLDPTRVMFEDRSRNTWENAAFARELGQPKDGETWLLVTSAFHMPRSVGCFRMAGWKNLIPYPVGYWTPPSVTGDWWPALTFDGGLRPLFIASREFAGLLYYRLTGRVDAWFPAP
jgi:uncharacterized SAM-binding protein YcdF (DUF218 family)